MEGSGSSGFDISKMSTAEKLLAGGSILLLIDSFLPWQKICADLGALGGNLCVASVSTCGRAAAGIFGVLVGLAGDRLDRPRCALHDRLGVQHEHGLDVDRQAPGLPGPRRGGVRALEVHLRPDELAGMGGVRRPRAARRDRVRRLEKVQSSGGFQMGDSSGGTMVAEPWMTTMGGGTPPPSSPPPSAHPASGGMPPSAPPPSGGMPPSDSSDMELTSHHVRRGGPAARGPASSVSG